MSTSAGLELAFAAFTVLTILANAVVVFGLYLEYGPNPFRLVRRRRTRLLTKRDFKTESLRLLPKSHIGSVLVIIGVAGEVLFGAATLVVSTKLETQHQKQLAPRDLSLDEQRSLGSALLDFKGQPIVVMTYSEFESTWFADELAAALKAAAQWNFISTPEVRVVRPEEIGAMVSGIMVTSPADDKGKQAATALINALSKRGFCVGYPATNPTPPPTVSIIVGFKSRHGICM